MALVFKWHFIAAVIIGMGASIAFVFIPRLLGEGVDQAFTLIQSGEIEDSEIRSQLLNTALLIIMVGGIRGILGFGQQFMGEALSQRVTSQMRMVYFDKLQALSFSFHDQVHTGQLMSRGLSDIEGVRMFVQMGLVRIFSVTVMIVAAGAFMAFLDWQLALLSLSFVPFMVFRSARLRIQLRSQWKAIMDALGDLTTTMQENLAGVRVVRAFSAQRYEEEKFDVTAREVVELRMNAARQHARGGSSISFAFYLAWAVLIWFGGNKVIDDDLTIGQLAQFFTYLAVLQMPVRMIPMIVNSIARAASAGGRVFEVMDIPSAVESETAAPPLRVTDSVVKFKDVTFSYGNVKALEHVTFEARPDHTIGIVGSPGSGKSSVANLLPRFYDPDSGQVTVDGQDLREADLLSVRSAIGLVQQDPFLFDGTIRDNIRYGNMSATDEDVIEAAKTAQVHEFIASLPDGYDAEIGERGVGLSGGQRQRVAIARTILTNPPVLIFDDSTSSVDAGTDARIRVALDRVGEGRTTIIIAHRLSSLQHADEILVFDAGRIVERGSHDELIALKGRYGALWDLQQTQGQALDD